MQIDADGVPLDLHGEAGDGKTVRVRGREPGSDIELPAVRTAGHHTANALAGGERKAGVGTGVLHRVHLIADPKEPDADAFDNDAEPAIARNLIESCHRNERQTELFCCGADESCRRAATCRSWLQEATLSTGKRSPSRRANTREMLAKPANAAMTFATVARYMTACSS